MQWGGRAGGTPTNSTGSATKLEVVDFTPRLRCSNAGGGGGIVANRGAAATGLGHGLLPNRIGEGVQNEEEIEVRKAERKKLGREGIGTQIDP